MSTSKIEWCDKTWNVASGCTPISEGCQNCYAKKMAHRLAAMGVEGYDKAEPFKVQLREDRLGEPLKWRKPQRVFVNSMGDLFHDDVPDEFTDQVFAVMRECQRHTFLLLTKRPERLVRYLDSIFKGAHSNVFFGFSAENEINYIIRSSFLMTLYREYQVRTFASLEPMLGPIRIMHE
ncbi:hypothetical protein LCGC14_2648170, partial [marine sediment metagenome]